MADEPSSKKRRLSSNPNGGDDDKNEAIEGDFTSEGKEEPATPLHVESSRSNGEKLPDGTSAKDAGKDAACTNASTTKSFDILYQDDQYVAINKPCDIMVHRWAGKSQDKVFVLQMLRDQLGGQHIYPIHRLDRATSGVLIFGKTSDASSLLGKLIEQHKVQKVYLAIVRGYVEEKGTINYPLAPEPGKPKQKAITHYKRLHQCEMPFSVGKYPSSRYSLVEVTLETGRRNQIRRHFSHLRHPIINDKKHGDIKHNKYFATNLETERLLLHSHRMKFDHPTKEEAIEIKAPLGEKFQKAVSYLFGEECRI